MLKIFKLYCKRICLWFSHSISLLFSLSLHPPTNTCTCTHILPFFPSIFVVKYPFALMSPKTMIVYYTYIYIHIFILHIYLCIPSPKYQWSSFLIFQYPHIKLLMFWFYLLTHSMFHLSPVFSAMIWTEADHFLPPWLLE